MYRAVTEYLLGIQADFNGLVIDSALPTEWETLSAEREFRGAKYLITYRRGEDKGLYVGSKKVQGKKVPMAKVGEVVRVEVVL